MDVLQVLLVDDEPFIVESIGSLLEGHAGISIEIHRAYSAAGALRNLEYDLVITGRQAIWIRAGPYHRYLFHRRPPSVSPHNNVQNPKS